jgi:glutaredoxin-like protein
MAYLSDQDQEYLRQTFGGLERPVKLIYFSQELECQYCEETREILLELAGLSEKIELKVYDMEQHRAEADKYGIDLIPALIVANKKDYGIRFYGVPGGYEFSSLIEDIVDVSKGVTDLSEGTKQALKIVEKPIQIRVFITVSCPHCPRAVRLAHQMAMESDMVRGEMIEAAEFPHLVHRYHVGAVPKIVINDTVEFEGALPENIFLDHVLQADDIGRHSG